MTKTSADSKDRPATREDILSILGELDIGKLIPILDLHPTIAELEEAVVTLEGDADVFGPGRTVAGVAGEIVALLTADEEEEERRA
ncbi:MAG: hypothetical protein C3F17_16380 [Bradyrhizobiaceae bacterium]|nr:MAG: hypothetical protein C3F17_16380 [Bradyrhizobiaceae bacterium]